MKSVKKKSRQERTRLANAETLHELAQQALALLDEGGTDLRCRDGFVWAGGA